MMHVSELLEILEQLPKDAPVCVVEGDDYENKKTVLSPYLSSEGACVIQFWN